jgi:hypothetical protein
MEKKRLEIIITVILGIVFVLVSLNSLSVIRKKTKEKIAVQMPSQGAASTAADAPLTEVSEDKLSWVKDPFSGKLYSSSSEMELRLEGILWDPKNPAAIINGEVVKIGDVLAGGSRIVAIKQNMVVVNDGMRNIEIKLGL